MKEIRRKSGCGFGPSRYVDGNNLPSAPTIATHDIGSSTMKLYSSITCEKKKQNTYNVTNVTS